MLFGIPELRRAIAAHMAEDYSGTIAPDEVCVTSGCNQAFAAAMMAIAKAGDNVIVTVPYFFNHTMWLGMLGIEARFIPAISGTVTHPRPEDAAALIDERTRAIILCSPNNPTGEVLSEDSVRSVLEETDAIVFLDEAYIEFAGKSLVGLVREYQNLVVGRTLSKAFGLAGMRLGYAIAPPWIAEQYRRVAPMFSISSPSLAAGTAALADLEWMKECVRRIVSERERMREKLPCALPSQGNFLFLKTRHKSKALAEQLLCRGIIVRDCSSFHGCGERCLRVTVGRREENDSFLEALEILDGKKD